MLLRVIVLAQAVAILLAFSSDESLNNWVRLGYTTLFVQWVALFSMFLLCSTSRWLNSLSSTLLSITVMLIVVTLTFVMSLLTHYVIVSWGLQSPSNITNFVLGNVTVALLVCVLGIQYFMLHYDRINRVQAQARAELDALHARIRPHFLFNCLNSAAELTHVDHLAAEKALIDLSKLLRAAMQTEVSSTLHDEILLTEAYISLEKLRLGNRLTVQWNVAPDLTSIIFPVLTLQPLVENAIRHGVEPMREGCCVNIKIDLSKEWITILVENAVLSVPANTQGNGLAIENIKQRLQLMYGDSARIVHSVLDGIYRVKLVVPLRTNVGGL